MGESMKVANIVHGSAIYGPGSRTVVWAQGCSIRCPGCWNENLWTFDGGREVSEEEIVRAATDSDDCGITILGGEPLDQAEETHRLISLAKMSGLNTFLYTGYEDYEVDGTRAQCVADACIVVIGRYRHSLRSEELLWRGSTNQRIIWNDPYLAQGDDLSDRRMVELSIDEETKTMSILGYPSEKMISEVTNRMVTLRSAFTVKELEK